MTVVVVLLALGIWLFVLAGAARLCGLNDSQPPPRRWVDDDRGEGRS